MTNSQSPDIVNPPKRRKKHKNKGVNVGNIPRKYPAGRYELGTAQRILAERKAESDRLAELAAYYRVALQDRRFRYNPDYHPSLIFAMFAEGMDETAFCAECCITRGAFDKWLREYPEFEEAYGVAREHAAAWWMHAGKVNLTNKDFNTALYKLFMSNRFGWSTDKSERMNTNMSMSLRDYMQELDRKVKEEQASSLPDAGVYDAAIGKEGGPSFAPRGEGGPENISEELPTSPSPPPGPRNFEDVDNTHTETQTIRITTAPTEPPQ